MHNGVFQTLEEVVDFFNKGGSPDSGIAKIGLTAEEKRLLIVFLRQGLKGDEIVFAYPEIP